MFKLHILLFYKAKSSIIPGINILNNFIIYYPNSIVLYLFIEIYFVHTIIEELYIESHFIQKLKFLRKS